MTPTINARRRYLHTAAVLALVAMAASVAEPGQRAPFSRPAMDARTPVVRTASYVVNAKIRPLLLFWIARDDIGEATLTWRAGEHGHRAFEFLIGSDPARTPRAINRWGFIVEELGESDAQVLGLMKESGEQTLEEAKASVSEAAETSTFKAARTIVVGGTATTGTSTVRAPADATYRDLDTVLELVPFDAPTVRRTEVPAGTHLGFLAAMESLMHAGVASCARRGATLDARLPSVAYLYNQTLYDLSFTSCSTALPQPPLVGGATSLVDGRFRIRNRRTRDVTTFRLIYATDGALREVPVRAIFRPRWWMEVELVLDRMVTGSGTSWRAEGRPS